MSLSPTLSHSRIASASCTRILVLPIGSMQEEVFQRRLADLRRIGHTIPMQSLTYHAPSKDTPFKTINWKRGKMLFEFLDGSAPASEAATAQLSLAPPQATHAPASYYSSQSDDTDPFTDTPPPPRVVCPPVSLALNSDWDELHVYAKVMAVICICDIPTVRAKGEEGLKMAIQQFQDVRAQMLHPGGPFIYKCYAFNPDKDFEKQHRDSPVEHWSVFPPDDAEEDEEHAHADFFLQTCLFDLAAGLLDNFEASIKKLPVNADLKSPLETPLVIAQTPEQIASRNKKTRPGRQKKYVGDYCLLAGDPVGAIKHFKAAADACRSANDMIWFASSLEGQASSLLAMEEEKEEPAFLDSVVSLYEESLSTLTKVPYASILSIESSFKLARYLLTGKKRLEASEILVRVYELKMDCSAHDQINLAVEAAILCHQIGFKRKFGFFLVQAAGLYRELHQSASCHALLRVAAPVYRLQGFSNSIVDEKWMSAKLAAADEWIRLEEDEAELEADTSKGRRAESDKLAWERSMNLSPLNYLNRIASMSESQRKERGFRTGRWVIIQKAVLEHLIFSAKQMQDDELCASCTTYLLRTLYPFLDEAYQASVISDLWLCTKFLPINTDSVDMSGLPVVHSVRPLELCSELLPLHDPQAATGELGPEADGEEEAAEEEHMGSCMRLKRAERVGGDVFLARPDEAQHKKHARELHFVANETMDVEVMLTNPLKLPLVIQAITLSVTGTAGDSFESYPCSMTLQGESLQRIVLTGIARREGALTIRGVYIRCFNLTWEHRVDSQGKGIRPSYDDQSQSAYCTPPPAPVKPLEPLSMNMTIEPAVPRLSLAYHVEGNMSSHSLLLGEKRKAVLLIQNVGRIEVSDIELKIDPQYVAMSVHSQAAYYMNPEEQAEMERNKQKKAAAAAALASPSLKRSISASEKNKPQPSQIAPIHSPPKRLVRYDPEELKAQLPLKVGAVLRIPVEIFAHTDCCGARFILSYAATLKSPLFRCVQLPVNWKVEHGLRLNHLHLLHFVSSNPASSSSLTNSNSPSSANALSPPLIIRRLSSEPSAEFPRMNSNDCMMILELTNSSLANFRLSCSVDLAPPSLPSSPNTASASLIQQEFAVEKSCEKRIILPLPRMSFGNTRDDEYLRRLAHSCNSSASSNTSWLHDESYQRFLRVFGQRVKLEWTSSEESNGVLAGFSHQQGIASVEIPPTHLVRLLPEPVQFEASLSLLENVSSVTSPSPEADSALLSPTYHSPLPVSSTGTRAQVGTLHRLSVALTNHSSEALSLEIGVLPFQEAVNGRWDTSLQSKLLLVGALTRQTQLIAPGQTVEHAINIVFTAVGRFNFQFTAKQCGETNTTVEQALPIKAMPVTSDPFAELENIASLSEVMHQHSAAVPETSSGASSPARPSNTVRRRSMLPSESLAFPQYELDEDSDEDESDGNEEEPKRIEATAQWPPSHAAVKDLVFRCQNIMVVQACL